MALKNFPLQNTEQLRNLSSIHRFDNFQNTNIAKTQIELFKTNSLQRASHQLSRPEPIAHRPPKASAEKSIDYFSRSAEILVKNADQFVKKEMKPTKAGRLAIALFAAEFTCDAVYGAAGRYFSENKASIATTLLEKTKFTTNK